MHDILRNLPEDKRTSRAWIFGISLVVYVTLFMAGGNTGDADVSMILNMDPILLLVIQAIASAFMFIVVALLFAYFALKIKPGEFFPSISWKTAGLTILIAVSFMVVNSAIGEWNMNLDFGDSDFAQWAEQSEEQLKVLTEHLTNFQSTGHFIFAFIVIALIPAIGEELIFRGLIQNLFVRAFKNHHIAIWVTGFIFAAIHMQFFGVAPRMFLGVIFGYMYHWSGKLSVAMLAHLVNNGLALLALYMTQTGAIEVTPEQMEESAPWPAVLIFTVISAYLLHVFYKRFKTHA